MKIHTQLDVVSTVTFLAESGLSREDGGSLIFRNAQVTWHF